MAGDSHDGVQIAAVADPHFDRTAAFATRTGARPYCCYQQMLDAERLDAVYICVPPHVHGPPETAVLAHRLPLFVEKPLALDVPTAERICAQIGNCGVPTATGCHWRYLDTVDQARALLADRPPRLLVGYRLDRDFIDAVRGKACRIRAPYPEALRTHRVAVAAARAAWEDSTVEIPLEDGDA